MSWAYIRTVFFTLFYAGIVSALPNLQFSGSATDIENHLSEIYKKLDKQQTEILNLSSSEDLSKLGLKEMKRQHELQKYKLSAAIEEKERSLLEAKFSEILVEKTRKLHGSSSLKAKDWNGVLSAMAAVSLEELDPKLRKYLLDISSAWKAGEWLVPFPKFLKVYFEYSPINNPKSAFGVYEYFAYESSSFNSESPKQKELNKPQLGQVLKLEKEKLNKEAVLELGGSDDLQIEIVPNGEVR